MHRTYVWYVPYSLILPYLFLSISLPHHQVRNATMSSRVPAYQRASVQRRVCLAASTASLPGSNSERAPERSTRFSRINMHSGLSSRSNAHGFGVPHTLLYLSCRLSLFTSLPWPLPFFPFYSHCKKISINCLIANLIANSTC